MTGSESFIRFVDSFHDSGSTLTRHEDYDLDSLCRLQGAEREAAEELLLERLEKTVEDPRVPRALVAMKPSAHALDAMKIALMAYPSNRTRVALAAALWQLEQSIAAVGALDEVARTSSRPDRRIAAVNALRDVPGEVSDEALLHVIEHDEDDTARMAAEIALYEKYRIEGLRRIKGTLSSLSTRLRDDDELIREDALFQLRMIVEGLREGRKPEALGLVPES